MALVVWCVTHATLVIGALSMPGFMQSLPNWLHGTPFIEPIWKIVRFAT